MLMSLRNKIPDCESRLMMECSGFRNKSSSPSHPDSWGGGFCSDPTDCCNGEEAWQLARLAVQWTAYTGEMQGLPKCGGCPGSTEPNLKDYWQNFHANFLQNPIQNKHQC